MSNNRISHLEIDGTTYDIHSIYATNDRNGNQIDTTYATVDNINTLSNKINTKQNTLTFDVTPIAKSSNPVTSNGVYIALSDKASLSKANQFNNTNTYLKQATFYNGLLSKNKLIIDPSNSDESLRVNENSDNESIVYIGTPATSTTDIDDNTWVIYKNANNYLDITKGDKANALINGLRLTGDGKALLKGNPIVTEDSGGTQYKIIVDKAINDGDGNKIVDTYAKKTDLPLIPVKGIKISGQTNNIVPDTNNIVTIPAIPTKVSSFTNDSGYLTSSSLTNYQTKLTFDSTPTLNSTNPVSSDGIKKAINTLSTNINTVSNSIVQSDWNITDTSSKAFIKNKPTNLVYTNTNQQIGGTKTFTGMLEVTNYSPSTYVIPMAVQCPSLSAGQGIYINLGRDGSQYNEYSLGFHYVGNKSTSNYFSLSSYNGPSYNFDSAGNANFPTSLTTPTLNATTLNISKVAYVPTANANDNSKTVANTSFVQTAIANLVGSAPASLNTLQELSTALGNDSNFATSVTNNIATKVSKAGDTMTGTLNAPIIQTGTGDTNYFQSRKFRGQGDASSYYHAIDFGYSGNDKMNFYEYGGIYNFYKNTTGVASSSVLLGTINANGWDGLVKGKDINNYPTTVSLTNGTVKPKYSSIADSTNSVEYSNIKNKPIYYFDGHNVDVKIGSFTATQTGSYLKIEICTGSGFNAQVTQNRQATIHFRTSNGSPADSTTLYACYIEYGLNGDDGLSFYIRQVDSTHFELYKAKSNYPGSSFMTVESSSTVSFTYNNTTVDSIPTDAVLIESVYTKAYTKDIPTRLSQLTNDMGYITGSDGIKGLSIYKDVTVDISKVVSSTVYSKYPWSYDVSWANISSDYYIDSLLSNSLYDYAIESGTNKATIYFTYKPTSNISMRLLAIKSSAS